MLVKLNNEKSEEKICDSFDHGVPAAGGIELWRIVFDFRIG